MGYFDWLSPEAVAAGWDQFTEGVSGGPPPDLNATRAADRAAAVMDAEKQTMENRPDQVDADGNRLTWTQGPDGKWTQTITRSAAGQAYADQHQNFGLGIMNTAQGFLGKGIDFSGLPGVSSGEEYGRRAEDALYSRMAARLDPMWQQREASRQQQLADQGLVPGGEAYNNSMGNLNNARNDAYSSAMLDSIIHGGSEASRIYNMDMGRRSQYGNELIAGHNAELASLNAALGAYGGTAQGGPQFGGFMGAASPTGVPTATSVAQQGYENRKGQTDAAVDLLSMPFQMVGGAASIGKGIAGIPGGAGAGPGPASILGPNDPGYRGAAGSPSGVAYMPPTSAFGTRWA